MRDAGYAHRPEGDDETGVVFGTGTAGGQATQRVSAGVFRGGPVAAPALLFNSTVGNAAASLAGLEFKLRGPNVRSAARKRPAWRRSRPRPTSSGRRERCAWPPAGSTRSPSHIQGARSIPDDGERPVCGGCLGPFDRARRGIVMGEGGFGLWIEDGAAARARGARAIGEIIGIGAASAAVSINRWPDRPSRWSGPCAWRSTRRPLSLPTCTSSMRPRMERRCSTVSRQWPSINSSAPRSLLSPRLRARSESSAPPERHLRLRRCYAARSARCRQSPDWRTPTSAANRSDWQEPPRPRQDLTCSERFREWRCAVQRPAPRHRLTSFDDCARLLPTHRVGNDRHFAAMLSLATYRLPRAGTAEARARGVSSTSGPVPAGSHSRHVRRSPAEWPRGCCHRRVPRHRPCDCGVARRPGGGGGDRIPRT